MSKVDFFTCHCLFTKKQDKDSFVRLKMFPQSFGPMSCANLNLAVFHFHASRQRIEVNESD
jgi:hypothetical protein